MSDSREYGLKTASGSDRYLMGLKVVVQLLVVFDEFSFKVEQLIYCTRDFTHIRYEQYGLSYLDLWTLPVGLRGLGWRFLTLTERALKE